jgi:NADH:ubiquinone oxidoreductase subunit 6 (subunit J)
MFNLDLFSLFIGTSIIILCGLFLIEKKPIYSLLSFVGIILMSSILLSSINFTYITFILIIVYASALTILFGFVVMLYGEPKYYLLNNNKYLYFIVLLFSLLFFSYWSLNSLQELNFNYFPHPVTFNDFNYTHNVLDLISRIGIFFYMVPSTIYFFILITLILLLSLIGVLVILSPLI